MITGYKHWFDYPIVVLAFECTSDDAVNCMPVEIAAVRLERCVLTARIASYCKPGVPLPPSLQKRFGEVVAGSPPPCEAFSSALALAGSADAALCAYDAAFTGTVAVRLSTGKQLQQLVAKRDWLDPKLWIDEIDKFEPETARGFEQDCTRRDVRVRGEDALSRAIATAELLCQLRTSIRGTLLEVLEKQKLLQSGAL